MAKLSIFKGGIKLGAGLKPMGNFPLVEAHDIVVDEQGTNLYDKLDNIVDEVLSKLPYAEEVSV